MDEINKLTLFDDDDDVSISWIDENLVDVYKGLIIDFNTEQPYLLNADMEIVELDVNFLLSIFQIKLYALSML